MHSYCCFSCKMWKTKDYVLFIFTSLLTTAEFRVLLEMSCFKCDSRNLKEGGFYCLDPVNVFHVVKTQCKVTNHYCYKMIYQVVFGNVITGEYMKRGCAAASSTDWLMEKVVPSMGEDLSPHIEIHYADFCNSTQFCNADILRIKALKHWGPSTLPRVINGQKCYQSSFPLIICIILLFTHNCLSNI